jgi:hypothetical protein
VYLLTIRTLQVLTHHGPVLGLLVLREPEQLRPVAYRRQVGQELLTQSRLATAINAFQHNKHANSFLGKLTGDLAFINDIVILPLAAAGAPG